MDDLISRQAAIDALMKILDKPKHAEFLYTDEICEALNAVPSAEKPGKWEVVEDYDGDSHYRCSACGEEWFLNEGTPSENNMNYCPNCGHPMEMSEEDENWYTELDDPKIAERSEE